MRITGYDDESNSVIVSFSDNGTDFTRSFAYQPTMYPDLTDPDEVLKRIAFSGISIIDQENTVKSFVGNEELVDQYRQRVGQELEFDVQQLLSPVIVDAE